MRSGISQTFEPITDHVGVLCIHALLYFISYNKRSATVGQINITACISVFIGNAVVKNVIGIRPALKLMADMSAVRIIVLKRQAVHMIDIKIMAVAISISVVIKFSKLNKYIAGDVIACKNAFFIVVKITMTHGKVNAFLPYSCAI